MLIGEVRIPKDREMELTREDQLSAFYINKEFLAKRSHYKSSKMWTWMD